MNTNPAGARTPIPAELENALLACLEKSRAKRPQTARELALLISRCPEATQWSVEDADAWWGRHDRGQGVTGIGEIAEAASQGTGMIRTVGFASFALAIVFFGCSPVPSAPPAAPVPVRKMVEELPPLTEASASNFAQLYDAVNEYRKRRARKKDGDPLSDNFWGVKLPNPLPGPGAKVVVTGNYSTAFTRATSGTEADPIMGILNYDEIQYLEPPPEIATLPGMKP